MDVKPNLHKRGGGWRGKNKYGIDNIFKLTFFRISIVRIYHEVGIYSWNFV